MPDPTSLPVLAVAGAALAAFWRQARALAHRLTGLVLVRYHLDPAVAAEVLPWLLAEARPSPVRDRTLSSRLVTFPAGDGFVPVELLGQQPLVLWAGWAPVLFAPGRAEEARPAGDGPASSGPGPGRMPRLTFVRGTVDPVALLTRAYAAANAARWRAEATGGPPAFERWADREAGSRHRVTRLGPQFDRPTAASSRPSRPSPEDRPVWAGEPFRARPPAEPAAAAVVLTPVTARLVADARAWLTGRAWYRERRVPWRTGWLLHGPPGTGKTSAVRAVAVELDLPVFVLELAGMTNARFADCWDTVKHNAPCVALVEDVDAVFDGRTNLTAAGANGAAGLAALGAALKGRPDDGPADPYGGGPALTFDFLLNQIDGVEPAEGVLLVLTTNRLEAVDPALGRPVTADAYSCGTRPGRIDRVVRVDPLGPAEAAELWRRVVRTDPVADPDFARLTAAGPAPAAQLQEAFRELALGRAFAAREAR